MLSPELLLFVIIGLFVFFIVNAHLREQYQDNNETVVYLFYAPWCSYSQKFLIIWDQIVRNKSNYPSNVIFMKVDVDLNHDKAKLYGIKQVPKVLIQKGQSIAKVPSSELQGYSLFNNYLTKSL
jgi:thioredoxin-like negative regulator of GroEL